MLKPSACVCSMESIQIVNGNLRNTFTWYYKKIKIITGSHHAYPKEALKVL